MKIVHVLRKLNPHEWAGTETALKGLVQGLSLLGLSSVVFSPKIANTQGDEYFENTACLIKRFHAFLPFLGLHQGQKERLISIGGNLMSLDLPWLLWKESDASVIHTHTLGTIGGIALCIARLRKLPFIVSLHGGALDLSEKVKQDFAKASEGGFSYSGVFSRLFRSQHILRDANAILTFNKKEAALLKEKYPQQKVILISHAISTQIYQRDHRQAARLAFPELSGKSILLIPARIDPVKNQGWVVDMLPSIIREYPEIVLVLVGSTTDKEYRKRIIEKSHMHSLEKYIYFIEPLPFEDPRLIGLFQEAKAVVLPSLAEPFGLVILEAWASKVPIISSRTSGASDLITSGENGWIFDLDDADSFLNAIRDALSNTDSYKKIIVQAEQLVKEKYDMSVWAEQMKQLYDELLNNEKKNEVCDHPR